MPWYHGTASSWSLWIIMSGVCTRSAAKIGEFSMYFIGASHKVAPMRLCVFSYWNARDMPVTFPVLSVSVYHAGAAGTGLLLASLPGRLEPTANAGLVIGRDNFTLMTARTG